MTCKKKPKISTIIPIYFPFSNNHRRQNTLQRSLLSIKKQNYVPPEIIIVVSGNRKQISNIILPPNIPTKVIYTKRNGPGAARNKGVKEATGEIIAFLDSDDVWAPPYLELVVDAYIKNNVMATYGYAVSIKDSRIVSRTPLKPHIEDSTVALLLKNFIHSVSAFTIRRDIFLKMDGFREDIMISEDLDFYIRISKVGWIEEIPYFVVYRYIGNDNLTNKKIEWSKCVLDVHKKLYVNPSFRNYRAVISYGGFRRLNRILKKTTPLTINWCIVLINVLRTASWLFTKGGLTGYIKYRHIQPNEKKINDIANNYKCIIQLDQKLLDLNNPFLKTSVPKIIGECLSQNQISTLCIPFNISKKNDNRIPLSICSTISNPPIDLILNPASLSDVKKLISSASFIIASNYDIIKLSLTLKKPTLGICDSSTIDKFRKCNEIDKSLFIPFKSKSSFKKFLNLTLLPKL